MGVTVPLVPAPAHPAVTICEVKGSILEGSVLILPFTEALPANDIKLVNPIKILLASDDVEVPATPAEAFPP